MENKAWFSNAMGDYRIGNKQGLRTKFWGEEWEPPKHEVSEVSNKVYNNMLKHIQGYALDLEDFPEKIAVFDEKSFKKTGQIFVAGRFYAVKKELANILKDFDFGNGGLVPLKIFCSDLMTPLEDNFYYINFGSRKNTFVADKSSNVKYITRDIDTGIDIWTINDWAEAGNVVLSNAARSGADIWIEEKIRYSFFMSSPLVSAIKNSNLKINFSVVECNIEESL